MWLCCYFHTSVWDLNLGPPLPHLCTLELGDTFALGEEDFRTLPYGSRLKDGDTSTSPGARRAETWQMEMPRWAAGLSPSAEGGTG